MNGKLLQQGEFSVRELRTQLSEARALVHSLRELRSEVAKDTGRRQTTE